MTGSANLDYDKMYQKQMNDVVSVGCQLIMETLHGYKSPFTGTVIVYNLLTIL